MARIIPEASEAELSSWRSRAEARVYRACRELPDSWLVLHGVPTLERDKGGRPRDGEADFVIVDPDRGVLIIEVKGGGVAFDPRTREWTSRDSNGVVHRCADPFNQAKDRKGDLCRRIEAAESWRKRKFGRVSRGHAVLFPDLDDLTLIQRPDSAPEIVGGRLDIRDLEGWIDSVFRFWAGQQEPRWTVGVDGLGVVEEVLAAAFSVQPRLGGRIEDEQEQRSAWTDRQWEALQGIRHWPRVAVSGGAGTGKTLLAVRRAQELADEGKKVLLLCFNTALGDFLKLENQRFTPRGGDPRHLLQTLTFHDLCVWWPAVAKGQTGRDFVAEARRQFRGKPEFDVILPLALAFAVQASPLKYDAVIVDEGQDFGEEYWPAVELITGKGQLIIFYDPNQAIFRNASSFPLSAEQTYMLQRNCRNTGQIHAAAYTHYRGPAVDPPPAPGEAPRHWQEPRPERVPARIASEVRRLITSEGVEPADIAVLLLEPRTKSTGYAELSAALQGVGVRGVVETHGQKAVLLETVGRFKGLEAAIVVVWVNGQVGEDQRRELYVALSRPRSLLVIAGDALACAAVTAATADRPAVDSP